MDELPSRSQLVTLVQRLLHGEYRDEEEGDQLLVDLQRDLFDPQVSDYIFWPDREMTAEEIVDRALAYQPIVAHWSPE
ncbi:hypothetical protein E7T06_14445 [Deinococcus sp. Arct2-2]|uniref:hypothetical protein n=1 Tax=Deinococcus sp. Arct2-2 TaxID=2568653 RepID=UPI0010A2F661|nr:hypothetical protein [Deinococcus sp. Arct2-2]THF68864.1 hypothetical protein E7T06_14445 [Deinococcus sp. Arct2-2]